MWIDLGAFTSATDLVSICFISLLLLLLRSCSLRDWMNTIFFFSRSSIWHDMHNYIDANVQFQNVSMRLFLFSIFSYKFEQKQMETIITTICCSSGSHTAAKLHRGNSDTRAQIVNVYQWAIIASLWLYNKLFIIFVPARFQFAFMAFRCTKLIGLDLVRPPLLPPSWYWWLSLFVRRYFAFAISFNFHWTKQNKNDYEF